MQNAVHRFSEGGVANRKAHPASQADFGLPRELTLMNEHELDFLHHLKDTLILLGCCRDVWERVQRAKDAGFTADDVAALRRFNITLLEDSKLRMASLNKISIRVSTNCQSPPATE